MQSYNKSGRSRHPSLSGISYVLPLVSVSQMVVKDSPLSGVSSDCKSSSFSSYLRGRTLALQAGRAHSTRSWGCAGSSSSCSSSSCSSSSSSSLVLMTHSMANPTFFFPRAWSRKLTTSHSPKHSIPISLAHHLEIDHPQKPPPPLVLKV
ncbi:hypothetical protein ACFE04_002206 [Oxalis oulophora]